MRVLSEESDLQELSSDAGMIKIRPKVGYVAISEEEVSASVNQALEDGVPLTPRGGGTSIPSQSIGRGIVLMQDRKQVVVTPEGSAKCEPGLVKAELNAALARTSRWMPVDPSSYTSCTVGGMVANNSSGIRTPKYGSTVDFVQELRVVIPGRGPQKLRPLSVDDALSGDPQTKRVAELILDGQKAIAEERPRVTKNSSGYRLERVVHDGVVDLPKLFVGSEGTLGVITEVTFTTRGRPERRVLFVVDASLDELDAIVRSFASLSPTAVELVDKSVFRRMGKGERIAKYSRTEGDYLVFCELEGTDAEVTEGLEKAAASKAADYEPMVVTASSEVGEAWEVRNETLKLAMEVRDGSRILLPGVEDLVVPPERLGDLVRLLRSQFEKRGLAYISYGHAADANLHARPLLDPGSSRETKVLSEMMEESFEAVWKMGGSMTGEHGDGMLRAAYVGRQYPRTHQLMKEIRSVYDPRGVLNPGVKII